MEGKEEKAITLIALVLTIIILLILAGISIASLTGKNGILVKASAVQETTKITEYKEILIMIGNGLRSEKILEDLSTKEYMDRYQEAIEKEIEKGDTFEGAKVERKSEGTIIVTTKEGYIYVVTEDEVKFLGKEGETTPPDLQESNVNFILSPDSWTNQDVRVEIKSTIEGYSIQYSLDGTTWENYKEEITVKENGTIYTRLINELEETGGSATKDITTIDKEQPNEATIRLSSTTTDISKSVTATVTQSDRGISDIDITKCKWIYTTNNSSIGTDEAEFTGGTFSQNPQDLTLRATTPGTYYLHVLSQDRAGNKRETIAKAVIVNDIDRIPPNEAQITLSATRTDIGKTVTATVKVSDNQSGIDIAKCKYIINNSANKLGVNSSSWSSGTTLTGVTSNVSLSSNTRGSLYLHVLSVDNYGNKTETVSNSVYFADIITIFTMSYVSDYDGGRYNAWPNDWTHVKSSNNNTDNLSSKGGVAYMQSNKTFDLTNLTSIKLDCIGWCDTSCGGYMTLSVLDGTRNVVKSTRQDFAWYPDNTTINLNLDVSSLSGQHYIRIEVVRTSGRYAITMKAPVTLTVK